MADENKEQQPVDLSQLGGFDFAPAWANGKPGDTSRFARFEAREERPAREERGPRRDDRGPRPAFGGPRRDDRGPKPAFGGPRRDDRGPRRDDRGPKPAFGGPRRDDRGPRRDDRAPREYIRPLDVDVRILPSQKELGPVIRNIQKTSLAYPLKQIAYFFLDHPEACMLRITPKKDADISFHQCKACGFVARSEEELLAHVVTAHLTDYYTAEEVTCDPPKGTFNCVARCGLSGVLLGPPNLHGYDALVRETQRTRYPDMSEEAYRARIEMVRDSEVVEAWRASATKKTIYRRKGAEKPAEPAEGAEGAEAAAPVETPAIEREAAELEFRRTIAPGLMTAPKSVELTADVALKCPDRALVFACRDALTREKRFPASLFYALRGAFHHRKLFFFRANDARGQEFVSAAKPTPLDTAHAIPELAALVKFVEEHPDTNQPAVVEALAAGDAAKATATKAHLAWLVEKGHLVGFFNGQLALPAENPRFRPPRKEAPSAPSAAPAAEAPVEPVAAPVEPVVEPVAEVPAAEAASSEPVAETAETVAEAPVVETPVVEAPAAETAPAEAVVAPEPVPEA